jgi:uncharacterized protein YgiM (DUF1202 family)
VLMIKIKNMLNISSRILVLLCFVLSLGSPLIAQEYVKILKSGTNVRMSPKTGARVVGKLKAGDIFELRQIKKNWYGINLYSGEYRYVHRSLVSKIKRLPKLRLSKKRKLAIFKLIASQEKKADAEASNKYPVSFTKQLEYSRILQDYYMISLFHKKRINPVYSRQIVSEGVALNWDF